MTLDPATACRAARWFTPADCRLEDFREDVEVVTDPAEYPHATAVEQNVLLYGPGLQAVVQDPARRREVQAELAHALERGPGVVVLQGAFPDGAVVDRATAAFEGLIRAQKEAGTAAGDHFAAPGANDRVWGAADKFALADPEAFADYYANDLIALVSEAWLGAGYQVTSQINVVNPGGAAQTAHRDYHLGFMSAEQAARYPAHVHLLSPALTLQGAVAHGDMPVESGPTMFLPHSQKYAPGYLAVHQEEFVEYFDRHHVQLPLSTGDAVFFNPALFHGAGHNRSRNIRRMANLLQISSGFGRAMETVDRTAMSTALYPVLLRRRAEGAPERWLRNVVAASAEGYAFPADLDLDQPVGGLAPRTQAEFVLHHLEAGTEPAEVGDGLRAMARRRSGVRQ
ncbi:phytanoyl-CoA dioxygenase family protein [Kocuria rosea]|jgi:ectoine hydroxylase-related dioxygenase (phytanoyl-CoA dioxygenase family)|uniref:phytanoyl-CoA dioxygenase family protein n=1 Tax=Kocuria rosea TaxID=1275 RepID=UPI00232FF592|nr:phytanoyl-CoA dioxygenase family protein [Kocuria rosea]